MFTGQGPLLLVRVGAAYLGAEPRFIITRYELDITPESLIVNQELLAEGSAPDAPTAYRVAVATAVRRMYTTDPLVVLFTRGSGPLVEERDALAPAVMLP